MAGSVAEWSATPANNNMSPPVGAPESGTSLNQLNDIHRNAAAAVRAWYNDPNWRDVRDGGPISTYSYDAADRFRINSTAAAAFYPVGKRVKIVAAGWTRTGYVTTCATAGSDTIVTCALDGSLSNVSFIAYAAGVDIDSLPGLPAFTAADQLWVSTAAKAAAALSVGASTFVGRKASGGIAAMTAGEALVVLTGVDGAGSGFDADLLDGQQGSYYAPVHNASLTGLTTGQRLDVNGGGVYGAWNTTSAASSYLALQLNGSTYGYIGRRDGVAGLSGAHLTLRSENTLIVCTGGVTERFYFESNGNFVATGQFYSGANVVWNAGNDGAGSGADADLLDGQQGSYYADIAARLGYTPLNSASYTAADVFSKVETLDGAGSGLDADLLDGQQGSYYTNIAARLGYTPYNATNPSGFISGISGSMVTAALGYTPWYSSNDGAGSGLDADLLDGQQGSYYAPIASPTFTGISTHARCDVNGTGAYGAWNVSAAGGAYLALQAASSTYGYIGHRSGTSGGGGTHLGIRSEGSIYFSTGGLTERFVMGSDGSFSATGTITGSDVGITSDARLKSGFRSIDDALARVTRLRGLTFDKEGAMGRRMGVIAQDLQRELPEAIIEIDGILHVDPLAPVGALIEAMKEVSGRLAALERKTA